MTNLQDRSFEAWQKSGAKNLFPVDPSKPLQTKPYMQRPGGSPDGKDLKKLGLKGEGLGAPVKLTEVDKKYSQQPSSGFSLPWTNDATKKLTQAAKVDKNAKPVAGKAIATKSSVKKEKVEEPVAKKGFLGLF